MSRTVTRRAFLIGLLGAASVGGWALLRDRRLPGGETAAPPSSSVSSSQASSAAPSSLTPVTAAAPTATAAPTTSTTLAPVVVEALCQEAWGASPAQGVFIDHTIDRLTVHHTARILGNNAAAPRAMRIHQDFHQLEREWPDIAYHYVIDLDGNIYEGRPVTAAGDTATNYDPTGHFLVACEGNFDEQELPGAQRAALIDVLAWASWHFGVDPETIAGHRDVAATSCPGDNLYALIESGELVAAVRSRQSPGVELTVVCHEAAFARVEEIERA